ncbi:MAG: hypothetical protein RL477_1234, partial [Pseudomonadota bacterium]
IPAAAAQDALLYKGADRQKVLEAGAKKEGKLVIYSSLTVNQALRPMVQAFNKKYPAVKAEFWRGDTRQISQKVLAEIRANALQADVLESSGLGQIMVAAKMLEKFSSPLFAKIPAQFVDKNQLLAPSRFSYMGTAYNTKLVPTGSQPRTFEDLLDPKWKGKLAWRAHSESGDQLFVINVLQAMGDQKGEEYLKKLAGQKIVNFDGSARTLVNRVIEGEYPVALNIFLHHPLISAGKGAPVASFPMEPVPSIAGHLMIPKGVKRPHAAMLFIDFYLSDEGQNVLRKAEYYPVVSHIRPEENIAAVSPRVANLKENYVNVEDMFEFDKKATAILKKYFY